MVIFHACGVFNSQLIRYGACSSYECFALRVMRLYNKLLTLTPPEIQYRPIWDLHVLYLLKLILFPSLSSFSGLCHSNVPRYLPDFTWFPTWPSPIYERLPWCICDWCGMLSGNAYPPDFGFRFILGLAYMLIVENSFPKPIVIFWTFHCYNPSVLSRFYFLWCTSIWGTYFNFLRVYNNDTCSYRISYSAYEN